MGRDDLLTFFSAPLALVAYPFQGIYKEIRTFTSKTGALVLERRREEGAYLLRVDQENRGGLDSAAMQTFYKL